MFASTRPLSAARPTSAIAAEERFPHSGRGLSLHRGHFGQPAMVHRLGRVHIERIERAYASS